MQVLRTLKFPVQLGPFVSKPRSLTEGNVEVGQQFDDNCSSSLLICSMGWTTFTDSAETLYAPASAMLTLQLVLNEAGS